MKHYVVYVLHGRHGKAVANLNALIAIYSQDEGRLTSAYLPHDNRTGVPESVPIEINLAKLCDAAFYTKGKSNYMAIPICDAVFAGRKSSPLWPKRRKPFAPPT